MNSLFQSLREFDMTVLRFLNPTDYTIGIPLLQTLSDTTSAIAYGVPVLLFVIGLILQRRYLLYKAICLLLTVLTADYTTLLLKHLFRRQRPYELSSAITQYSDGGNFSFPSGHTTMAAAMAAGVYFLFPEWRYRPLVLAWSILVGFSRVYLGVHYPSDVLGAMMIAIIVALFVFSLSKRFRKV